MEFKIVSLLVKTVRKKTVENGGTELIREQ